MHVDVHIIYIHYSHTLGNMTIIVDLCSNIVCQVHKICHTLVKQRKENIVHKKSMWVVFKVYNQASTSALLG